MDAVPGSSKMIDCPNKKCKFDDEGKISSSSTDIDVLPDEMIIKIFSYLKIDDKLNVQKVCCRWYHLVRTEVFWRYVNLTDISPSLFIQLLVTFPSCVSKLRLVCHSESLPLSLPEVIAKLHDQCLSLNTLVLENIHLLKNLHNVNTYFTRRSKLLNTHLLEAADCVLAEPIDKIINAEFRKEDDIELENTVLPHLKILSLRRVLFSRFHLLSHITISVFPNIIVLDLSYSKPLSIKYVKNDMFCTLTNLEELYLAGWKISDLSIVNFLKQVKKLRVLDLEHTKVTDSTISTLKQNCVCLEELYLAYSKIGDFHRTEEDKDFFPQLHSLCLIETGVTPSGVEILLAECPSIKHIVVSFCTHVQETLCNKLSSSIKEKLLLDCENNSMYCDHFLKTKYCNF